jgi:hypothetical protein
LSALNQALAASGITVSLAGNDGGTGSAGVQILQKGKLPFNGSPVGVARTLIGNASSSIVGSSSSLTPDPAAGTAAGGSTTGTSTPGTDTTPTAVAPATLPALPADTGSVLTPVAGAPPLTGGATGSTSTDTQPPTVNIQPMASGTERTALETLNVHPQLEFFYLAFAIGSGLLVLTSVARRAKGGRSS